MKNLKMDYITILSENQKHSFIRTCKTVLENAALIKNGPSSVEMTDGKNKMKVYPVISTKDENLKKLQSLGLHQDALDYAKEKVLSGELKTYHIDDICQAARTGELVELDADNQIKQLDAIAEKRKNRNSENIADIHKNAFEEGNTKENVVEDVYSLAVDNTNKMIETLNLTPQLIEVLSPEKKEHLSKKLEELHEVTEGVIRKF